MNKTDELIERALSAEDRELLDRHAEPGYFEQATGLFRGRQGWVVWLTYLTAVAAFAGCGVAFWRMWTSADPSAAVRMGVLACILFQYAMMAKSFLASRLEGNRVLREVKRMELQIAMLRDAAGNAKR